MEKFVRNLRPIAVLMAILLLLGSLPFTAGAVTESEENESPISDAATSDRISSSSAQYSTDEPAGGIREITELREETVKHFALTDGTCVAVSYPTAVHRRDDTGAWQDIDNTLSHSGSASVYATSDLRTVFRDTFAANETLVTLSENGYAIGMTPVAGLSVGSGSIADPLVPTPIGTTVVMNAAPRDGTAYYSTLEAAANVNNTSSILYTNVKENTDLEYVLTGNTLKESIILNAPTFDCTYEFLLSCNGLTPTLLEDSGAIFLSDTETGDPKYVIPAPYMFDADGTYSYDVFYTLEETDETDVYRLTVTADEEWINTAGRSFPVTVDPTIYTANISADSYVSEEFPEFLGGYSTYLSIGGGMSAYIRIAMPTIPENSVIDSAALYVTMNNSLSNTTLPVYAYQVTGAWNESTLCYDNRPSYNTSYLSSVTMSNTNVSMVYSFNIKSAASAWFAGTAQNYGIMLTAGGSVDEGILIEAKELRDVDGNSTAGSYMVVSYTEYVADGVYAFRNASYSTSFLSVTNGNLLAGGSLSLKTFTSGTTPADTSNFSTSRASLFKVSRVGSTNRYIIRSMLNSNLTFAVSANGSITTKTIPSNDADVAFSDTFYLEADSYGFSIIPAAYSSYLLSASSSSSVTTAAVDPNAYYTRYGWRLSQYAGSQKSGADIYHPTSQVVGTQVVYTPIVWSTRINVNAPSISIASSYASLATGVWNSTAGTFTVTLHDEGTIVVQVYVRGTSTTYSAGSFSFTLTLPHKEATYYIENAATTCFMDVEGPSTASGAAIQQWAFHGGTQSRWNLIHVSDGYYRIQSVYSGLYVGTDSLNPSTITQTNAANDTTLWKFVETVSGNQRIVCKSTSTVISAASASAGNGSNLIASSYANDTSLHDEWILHRMLPVSGSEIPYEPELWVFYEDWDWEQGFQPSEPNCYSYVLNCQISPTSNKLEGLAPGKAADCIVTANNVNNETLVNAVKADSEVLGFTFVETTKDAVCPEGTYKIAICYDPKDDYHFYRQNPDGTWSHKRGITNATNVDANGKLIFDPETANRYYSNMMDYSEFCGFFYITPLTSIYTVTDQNQ